MSNHLPLEGLPPAEALFELTPALTRNLARRPDLTVSTGPPVELAGGVIRLDLPRWDTAWEVSKRRGGWPKVDPKTRKVIKKRKVWDALWGNARPGHIFAQRSAATKEVIDAVTNIATAAGLRPCSFMEVTLVWAPGRNTVADEDNLWHLLKACCDALARGRRDLPGLHLVPSDTNRHMRKIPRIDWPPVPAGLWLEIRTEVDR